MIISNKFETMPRATAAANKSAYMYSTIDGEIQLTS